jgi:peroxiredoxin/uncharacterized membrane protein YphA (DoxX/SURF4 family)
MEIALLVARVLLAVVFVVAGLAKLADRAGSRQALRDFGVAAALATPLGTLLPLAELAVAVALLPAASAWWGALGALGLLLLFSAGIGANLARGRAPDCHCFGQLHSAPMGWSTLVRTGALALVAGFVSWQGRTSAGPSVLSGLGAWPLAQGLGLIAGVLALALGAAEGWVLVQLLQQNGRLLARLEALEAHLGLGTSGPGLGLPIGTPAPPFHLPSLDGETLTLDALCAPGKPVLLLFTDPRCGPCRALLPDIGRWQRDHGATLTFALLSRGTPEANRAKVAKDKMTRVLVQQDREVAQVYQVDGTPAAVLVQPDGTIGSPLALGAEAIRALVARTVLRPVPVTRRPAAAGNGQGPAIAPGLTAGPKIGDPAPALIRRDGGGR